jgi:galactose mutarotase-like enzyme
VSPFGAHDGGSFRTETRQGLEGLVLVDDASHATLVLAPARGGIATRLTLSGEPILYMDDATLNDPTKNVRGGIPVLFPQPGKLEGDAFVHAASGAKGTLRQHGFARNLPWEVVGTATDAAASATLRLASDAATRAAYPWDFVAEYTYTLDKDRLRIDQRFENRSATPMPFGAGFHPYFQVGQADKGRARIGTPATRGFDNVTKTDVPVSTIDLTAKEVDLHLYDHGVVPCTLTLPGRTITVRGSPEFSHWVIWTLAGKDFVCVEPWTCPGNALNTGERLLVLAPGETRSVWIEIARS